MDVEQGKALCWSKSAASADGPESTCRGCFLGLLIDIDIEPVWNGVTCVMDDGQSRFVGLMGVDRFGGSVAGRDSLCFSTSRRIMVATLSCPPVRRVVLSLATEVMFFSAIQAALNGPNVDRLSHCSRGLNKISCRSQSLFTAGVSLEIDTVTTSSGAWG